MSGSAGQAAGLAVGAAVGSLVPGVGTVAGAAVGAGLGGLGDSVSLTRSQRKIDTAALKLNQAQAHAKAAATSAVHAQNFRQALASQVSIATMRGGSGSLATQFGNQAYRSFLEDQQAIEAGVMVGDVQTKLGMADINARSTANTTMAVGRAISAFDGINLNMPRQKKGV